MHRMSVLLSALAQTQFEQGGSIGGIFPCIPAFDMALTHSMAFEKSIHFSSEFIFPVYKSL